MQDKDGDIVSRSSAVQAIRTLLRHLSYCKSQRGQRFIPALDGKLRITVCVYISLVLNIMIVCHSDMSLACNGSRPRMTLA